MNIYSKVLPYVYRLDNPVTGEFYIGYREANTEPSHIDFPKYKTSAPKVKEAFDQFEWHIVAEFFDGNDAFDFEQQLIHENWSNKSLNKSCFYNKNDSNQLSGPIRKNKGYQNIGRVNHTQLKQKRRCPKLKLEKLAQMKQNLELPKLILVAKWESNQMELEVGFVRNKCWVIGL